jgi:hypothetical protein
MGCWNGKNIQIRAKLTDKCTIDELPVSKIKTSEQKFEDVDHDSFKGDHDFIFEEPSLIKSFKTQEFSYSENDREFNNILTSIVKKSKRWKSIQNNMHKDEAQIPSKCN